MQPSPYDIWATSDLVDLIKTRQEITDGKPKASFVISRMIKGTKLSNEIRSALEEFELNIFEHGTSQKVSYPTSASEGGTVYTVNDSKAIYEINKIFDDLQNLYCFSN